MLRLSTFAVSTLTPALKVLSTTLPDSDVLQLGAHERRALAGLDVLELDDGPQLAVEVEDQAVLEVVGRCHGWFFAFVTSVLTRRPAAGARHPREGMGIARSYRAPTGGRCAVAVGGRWLGSDPDGEVRDVAAARVAGHRGELVDAAVVAEDHVLGQRRA